MELLLKSPCLALGALHRGDSGPEPDTAATGQVAISHQHPAAITEQITVLVLGQMAGEQRVEVDLRLAGPGLIEAGSNLPFRHLGKRGAEKYREFAVVSTMEIDEGAIEGHGAILRVIDDQGLADIIDGVVQAPLRQSRRQFGFDPPGDVGADTLISRELPGLVETRHAADREPSSLPGAELPGIDKIAKRLSGLLSDERHLSHLRRDRHSGKVDQPLPANLVETDPVQRIPARRCEAVPELRVHLPVEIRGEFEHLPEALFARAERLFRLDLSTDVAGDA